MIKAKILLVDGHNVIFSVDDLRKLGDAAPQKLAEMLNSSRLAEYDIVDVIFDSKEDEVVERKIGRVVCIYSGKGKKADEIILKRAEELSRKNEVHIVSADWAVQAGALRIKSLRMTPDELLKKITAKEKSRMASKKKITLYDQITESEKEKLDKLYKDLLDNSG